MENLNIVYGYVEGVIKNIGGAADGMTLQRWLRIIAIVGGYILARPYIDMLARKWMMDEHTKDDKEAAKKAKISPNALRGEVGTADSDEDEEEEGTSTGAEWGQKATKRQKRTVLQKILEAEDKLKAEDQDNDLVNFLRSDVLVDYKEGEDGW